MLLSLPRQVATVFRTELTDHSRDRRSLMAAFTYALFGPVFMVIIFNFIAARVSDERPVNLAVIGAAYAPTLVAELERREIVVERRDGPAPEGVPRLDGADALLVIPADYPEDYLAGRPADLFLYRDESRQTSEIGATRAERALRSIALEIGSARLVARGIPSTAVAPFQVQDANIAAAGGATLQIANSLLVFFLFGSLFASMSMAIDSTAGERERKSLQPLLAQPVDPHALILGKWATASLFGTVGTIVTVVLGVTLLRFAPLEQLGIGIPQDAWTQVRMIVVLLPLAIGVAAGQIMIALAAKSYKEAQVYLQMFSFVPIMLSYVSMFSGRDAEGFERLVPVVGHMDVLRRLVADGTVDWGQAGLVTLITLALGAVALWYAQTQLKSERILGTT